MARKFFILVERTEYHEYRIELTEDEVREHFPEVSWDKGVSQAGEVEALLYDGLPEGLCEEHREGLDTTDPYDHEVKITAWED